MSYSRWGNSCWYTFYCDFFTSSKKEDQVMACWYGVDEDACIDWTYAEILKLVNNSQDIKICARYGCTKEEAAELIGYMKRFMADVESGTYL